ncbi:PGF-CTERM sorting domain-containing protein [Halosimplex rubrum]|uniref:PGF-CTERM sorting domain-containing protein n=1 Tax=Halosimplex rubrum TaxID=869889 RepID=A0A7D5P7X7_9EURY|nr:Hvo_1808 family surface protein [Halosimplex rubrum]QLH79642.1 PGF-CTERM sorting domain-containing protein [Halosimplex rubrum]
MRSALSVVVAGLVVLSAVAALPAAAAADPVDAATTDRSSNAEGASSTDARQSDDACAPVSNGSAPGNPHTDTLGWENGCWYNESIQVDRSDGLNDTELDAVVARGMARVEQIRELEFNETVPVDVVSREKFSANTSYNTTTNGSLHQNVKWEAMLMVGENTDAISVQESNTGASVGGYYSPTEERIVIVSENTTAPKMNEITLSQELFHALQDQRYNISGFDQYTEELHNARDGIIEGDGNLVDKLYSQRCGAEWDCLMPQMQPGGGSGGQSAIHYGMYLVTYQPYSDGPKFVDRIYRAEGWEGVNAVYENPPASTEQTIHPEKYGEDEPTNVSFADTSGADWTVPHLENGTVDYAQFGEAGLATMLFYPYYDSERTRAPVVGPQSFFNLSAGGALSSYDPINYSTQYTDGWDGDRLYPYVTDDSAETNETGYVWKTVWDSEGDAADFVEGYSMLLDYYGAQSVDDSANTYRIADGSYADAFYVNHTGTTVTLVNAPTVEGLSAVRAGAAPAAESNETDTAAATATDSDGTETTTDAEGTATDAPDTDSDTATATDTATEEPMTDDGADAGGDGDADDGGATDAPAETTASGGPGFGLAGALVALALVALLGRRRE